MIVVFAKTPDLALSFTAHNPLHVMTYQWSPSSADVSNPMPDTKSVYATARWKFHTYLQVCAHDIDYREVCVDDTDARVQVCETMSNYGIDEIMPGTCSQMTASLNHSIDHHARSAIGSDSPFCHSPRYLEYNYYFFRMNLFFTCAHSCTQER